MPIRSKAEYLAYLDSDLRAHKLERWGWRERLHNPVVGWQRLYRRTEYVVNCRRGLVGRLYGFYLRRLLQRRSILMGFDIPINVFGPGLSIGHWGTITVNPNARVGSNCRIHPSTCIGEAKGLSPVIGDHAYIGPGAKIYGDITLGNHVTIGANAVVGRSFPDGVTLAGAPARIISRTEGS